MEKNKNDTIRILYAYHHVKVLKGRISAICDSLYFSYQDSIIKLYQNPIWASKIEFKNGKNAFFCSPKSMFEFYFNEEKWKIFEIESQSDFTNILITDYKTSKIVDAKKAFFVYGSSKISPAGDDLVAFESKEDASNYSQNNNGKRIFSFSEVKNSLIRLLNGRI